MPSTTEEFHALVLDLESALADISGRMGLLIQAVTSQPAGNVVDPADLAALHVAIDEAHSLAAAAVQPQAGTPVPDTGTPAPAETPPTAGPVEDPPTVSPADPGSDVADSAPVEATNAPEGDPSE